MDKNEDVLERTLEKRRLFNPFLCRKTNCSSHVLGRNCLLHDAITRQTEVKEVARRKGTLFHDDL